MWNVPALYTTPQGQRLITVIKCWTANITCPRRSMDQVVLEISYTACTKVLVLIVLQGRALSQGLPSPTPEPEAKAVQPAMAVTSVKATIPVPSNETAASAPQGPTSSPQAPLPEPT